MSQSLYHRPNFKGFNQSAPIPENETPEQRTRRLLKLMPKSVDGNPRLMAEFLKRAIASEDAEKRQSKPTEAPSK